VNVSSLAWSFAEALRFRASLSVLITAVVVGDALQNYFYYFVMFDTFGDASYNVGVSLQSRNTLGVPL